MIYSNRGATRIVPGERSNGRIIQATNRFTLRTERSGWSQQSGSRRSASAKLSPSALTPRKDRHRQMHGGRHHPQAQAPRQAGGWQEEDASVRPGGHPPQEAFFNALKWTADAPRRIDRARREADIVGEEGIAQVIAPAEAPLEADPVREQTKSGTESARSSARRPRSMVNPNSQSSIVISIGRPKISAPPNARPIPASAPCLPGGQGGRLGGPGLIAFGR